jgi:hypothetical protein
VAGRPTLGPVVVVATLAFAATAGGPGASEAILPPAGHVAGEPRALSEAHGAELRALVADLDRCGSGLSVERHGISFRRPQADPGARPHLTLWVWLHDPAPVGGDPTARAADAFRRLGQPLLRRLLQRSGVFADGRVGGYGLVLSWLGPTSRAGRTVAESLILFADKLATANFVHETIGPATFLARATVRIFDGQTEVGGAPLAVADDGTPAEQPC